MEFEEFSAVWQPAIRDTLAAQLARIGVPELKAAMQHLVGRGKLFRPLLALAAYQSCDGRSVDDVLPLLTPLELIHTFTLIHDDLPCMDDAELRRGVPAVHVQYGEAPAVLAGDALLNLALYLIATEPAPVTPEVRLLLVRSATRATEAVVEGQMLDLQGEGRELTLPELERMEALKTGALIGACAESGALLAGASPEIVGQLRELGERIGLAFQVRDDLLSIDSTEDVLGKTLSTDELKQKATFVRLLGSAGARSYLKDIVTVIEHNVQLLQLPHEQQLLTVARQAALRDR